MAEALQAIHPTTYPPERASLLSLYENIKNTEKTTPHTLQGCLITHTHKEIHFFREPAAITETKNLMMSETSLWDQRWHVTYPEGFESPLTLRALGNTAHSILDNITPTLRKKIPQGRRRAGLPSLWKENNLVAIPITTARLQGVWPPTKKKTSF